MITVMGWAELVLLALFTGGGSTDAVSLFPARDYFALRGIDPTPDKLLELATQEPNTPKAQIQQLQAIRLLAENRKWNPATTKAIEDIAAGAKANDKEGFAQLHARKALAAAAGKRWTPEAGKEKASAGLSWFPADALAVGVVDLRLARIPGTAPFPETEVWKLVPEKIKRESQRAAFDALEKTGNVAFHRGAVAVVGRDTRDEPALYARFSGKYNREWLVKALPTIAPDAKLSFKESKGPAGEKVWRLELSQAEIALLDDGEALLAVPFGKGAGDKLIDEMLKIRAGKGESVLKGKRLAGLIAKAENALGFFAAEVPPEIKGSPVLAGFPTPDQVVFSLTPAVKALDLHLEAVMSKEEDVKAAVTRIFGAREEGIAALKKGIPGGPDPAPLIRILESVQVEGKGKSVHVRLLLPEETLRGLAETLGWRAPAKK